MRAEAVSGAQCQVTLSDAEVVALHELLARSEWAGLFDDPLDPNRHGYRTPTELEPRFTSGK